MRAAFSEYAPDYSNYVFPYHVWGFLEDGETARDALALGFLVGKYDFSRFHLTRSIRVALAKFHETGRIRYAQRKCADVKSELVKRSEFDFNRPWKYLADRYFQTQKIATAYRKTRFLEMIDSPFATHVFTCRTRDSNDPVGIVPVMIDRDSAQYGIPVTEPARRPSGIGYYMMSSALSALQRIALEYVYLGSCYSTRDLYKTRFAGMQFFNGRNWVADRRELHFVLENQHSPDCHHLLSFPPYAETFGSDPTSAPGSTIVRLAAGPADRLPPGSGC